MALDREHPDQNEEQTEDARQRHFARRRSEESEVVYCDRGRHLPGEEEADLRRRAEQGREDYGGQHVESPEKPSRPDPPRRADRLPEPREAAAYEQDRGREPR